VTTEIWKPIADYEARYEISNLGRVRSIRKGIILKFGKSKGYHNVTFWSDDGQSKKTFTIHKLVALHFVGPSNGRQVRHRDGSKLNNADTNLVWGTAKENAEDRALHGTTIRGEKHHRCVLTETKVRDIRALASQGLGPTAIGRIMGMNKARVNEVTARKRWKHVQ
jgi:hypothetical protein